MTSKSSKPPAIESNYETDDSETVTDEEYQLVGEGVVRPVEPPTAVRPPSTAASAASGFDALMSLADAAEAKNDVPALNTHTRPVMAHTTDRPLSKRSRPSETPEDRSKIFKGSCGRHISIAYSIFYKQNHGTTSPGHLDPTFEARRLKERTEWIKRQRTEMPPQNAQYMGGQYHPGYYPPSNPYVYAQHPQQYAMMSQQMDPNSLQYQRAVAQMMMAQNYQGQMAYQAGPNSRMMGSHPMHTSHQVHPAHIHQMHPMAHMAQVAKVDERSKLETSRKPSAESDTASTEVHVDSPHAEEKTDE